MRAAEGSLFRRKYAKVCINRVGLMAPAAPDRLTERTPDTLGEEGLRDMQLMADIYQAAQSGTRLQL